MKKILRENFWPLLILFVLSLFKFYRLDGGINLGEPDEFIHADVANNFHFGPWPRFAGGYWFFELPLYPFLGYLVSFIFPGRYLALRLVSVLFSLLLTSGLYLYLKYKISPRVGFLAALLFVFSPMSIYYSRLGLLDMSSTAAAMLFLFTLDYSLAKKSLGFALFSGLFLSLSLLVKYSALIYLLLIFFVWLSLVVRINFSGWTLKNLTDKFREKKTLDIEPKTTAALALVLILVVPVALLLRLRDPYLFKLQLFTSLGFIKDFWRLRGGELTLGHYGTEIVWWVSWPIFLLMLAGLPLFLKRWRSFSLLFFGLILTLLFVLPHTPFYPRYFFPLIPFLVTFASLGLDAFVERLAKGKKALQLIIAGIFLVLLLPLSYEAWQASQHLLIEKAGALIKAQKRSENPWIFTNYWPNYFGLAAGSERATWLTASVWDAGAYVKNISASPLELLGKEGGFVVLEELYAPSPIFIHNRERLEAWRVVREKYQPAVVINDNLPNFPHFRTSNNKIFVYEINPE